MEASVGASYKGRKYSFLLLVVPLQAGRLQQFPCFPGFCASGKDWTLMVVAAPPLRLFYSQKPLIAQDTVSEITLS